MADIDVIRRTSEFRKIELQSPADLQYLIATTKRAARQKIDLAFPQSVASHDDELRRRVESLVDEYVRAVFAGVRSNVTVNGIDLDGEEKDVEEQEFEPVDMTMLERIRALELEKEKLTEQVANLRRTAPRKAAENFRTRWLAESDAFDLQTRVDEENAKLQVDTLDAGEFKRWDEVERTWEKASKGLIGLKGGLTETVARLERAKEVAEHMGQD